MKNKIAILGSGAMGTACGTILNENDHEVIIYGIDNVELEDLKNGFNKKYFGKSKISKFDVTNDLNKAIENANFIVIAIPSQFIPEVFLELVSKIKNETVIINVAKGFWPNSNDFVHAKMAEYAKSNKYIEGIVSLVGPSFAVDIINKNITIINSVCENINLALKVKKIFANSWFGVVLNDDVIGAEIGSTYKNVLAIASGMAEALGYSTNTQAALLAMGLKEMQKYAQFLGAKSKTVYDLCGLGDLILTGLSEKSRNYTFGKNFFNKENDSKNITVEGLRTLEHIYNQIKDNQKIKLPLINGLYKIVYNMENPKKIIEDLIKSI
ncbi:NAD(P)H-dependent glycerol-3-phosphate dehydrogenase [Mycoplasma enhydrae]|uniref:NAD(P)H-dependent glycerol-3-phosphate dehydrogenase n=1 Tax=Mycoplasma enhydrae TaxID=2499220 RepID=UPI00197BEFBC|nr:NAD(P)H-dependent glycerol-3-phosphate dehydrogenase [Mycoplasma enhydrae]MBN4089523.1 NAD(P)-binding domain-containing protein [Mycoplasma enhydrae]